MKQSINYFRKKYDSPCRSRVSLTEPLHGMLQCRYVFALVPDSVPDVIVYLALCCMGLMMYERCEKDEMTQRRSAKKWSV